MQVWDEEEARLRAILNNAGQAYRHKRFQGDFWRAGAMALLCVGLPAAFLLGTTLGAKSEPLTGTIRVIDGDTLWHYPCQKGEGCKPEKIRLLDIDAPESFRSACEAELIAGLRAKARVHELLAGQPITIERCDQHGDRCQDRFGRTLARIHIPAGELGALLLKDGLALPYVPGKKTERTAKWCGNG